MVNTLYDYLRRVERTATIIRDRYVEFNQRTENSEYNFGFQLPKVEIPELEEVARQRQIKLFQDHSRNPVLQKALMQTQTIQNKLFELEKDWQGIWMYLPRKKDRVYNQQVEELNKIIPASYLEKRGILRLDNFVGTTSLTEAVCLTGYCNMESIFRIFNRNPNAIDIAVVSGMMLGLAVFGPVFGAIAQSSYREKFKWTDARSAAKYIDKKIQELFYSN